MAKETGQRPPHLRRRRRRRSALYRLVSFFIICICLIVSVNLFFKITEIQIEGSELYTDQEILEAADVHTGQNMFLINKYAIAENIQNNLAYIDKVTINRDLPNTLVITVEESYGIAYIQVNGQYWLLDQNFSLLEQISAGEIGGLMEVTGFTPLEPAAGSSMQVDEGASARLQYAKEVMQELISRNMAEDVGQLDAANISNLRFTYQDRYTIELGPQTDTAYKMDLLESALIQLGTDSAGTINLATEQEVHFVPQS